MIHGDGDIYLVYFENGQDRFCYVIMQSDVAYASQFYGRLETGKYYDWETPYGYGGPLADKPISQVSQEVFIEEITSYCVSNHIVSQFVRFHPLLKNYEVLPQVIETRYLRDTIYIDTSNPEIILSNMDGKNRNMVRKAKKNGVIIQKTDIREFDAFIPMYNETMKKNMAEDYYSFKIDYFESLCAMKDNAFILYAMYEGIPISGSIIFYNDRYMHYHLSGSYMDYRKYASSNLLLYEAACLASKKGIKQFHLGGGMSPNDSLFGFKKQFNKNGRASFVVGKTIFDDEAYKKLLTIRKNIDSSFNTENGFLIQYRG